MSAQPVPGSVLSADGTRIGFLQLGVGPALIFVHGALSTGDTWLEVATRISDQFTCFLMDRRGYGRSTDGPDYSLARECEDIVAMVHVAGPGSHILGHSSGAICVLEGAFRERFGRLVLYEPPLPIGEAPLAMLNPAAEHFRAAIVDKKFEEALTILARDLIQLRAEEITRLRAMPLWSKWGAALIPTISRQSKAIFELDRDLERYRQLSIPTLLLVGTATAAHHKAASAALAHVLPNVRTVYLEGEGHVACLTAPDLIAKAVSEFLQASAAALPEGGEAKAAQ